MKPTLKSTPERRKAPKKQTRKRPAKPQASLVLPRMLDMRAARELKQSLEGHYHGRQPCIIDASAVTSVSTGCLQILVAFAASMSAAAVAVTLRRPAAALLQAIEQLGLSRALATCAVED